MKQIKRLLREIAYQLRWALPGWCIGVATNWWPDNRLALRLRGWLMAPFLGTCGKRLELGRNVTFINPHGMRIGNDVYIAQGCWMNAVAGLTLEDEVILAPYVVISTTQHVFKGGSVRFGGSIAAPVAVGRGSWLAAHASVKCGVRVGQGTLVAANACVVATTPDHVIVGGVPGKVIAENRDGEADFTDRASFRTHMPA